MDGDKVLSATGKIVERGAVKDRAPEIRYEELDRQERIGKGCFGSVYKGKCRGITVAIKELLKQSLDPKLLEDFRKEVDILTQMRHPNVVLFLGACTEAGKMAIVCELLKDNVQNLLKTHKSMPLITRVRIAKGTASGMAWLHGAHPQVIHRDLKPANLLVDEHWNVKVCDFGLSQVKLEGEAIRDGKNIPGTPLWMAPEVLLGKEVTTKADIYSFGIVFWEIITGEELFPEMDSFGTFKRAITKEGVRPKISASVHPSIANIMRVCWDADPIRRPSFVEIIKMLDDALIDCLVTDPVANRFWKSHSTGNKEFMTWSNFAKNFSALIPASSKGNLNLMCLKRIISEPTSIPNAEDPDVVALEKFSHMINWFGPIDLSNNSFTILDHIRTLMKQEYFHGDISKEDAEHLLAGQEAGCFLLRTSNTEADKPFTISKVTQDGKINHQRITKKDGVLQLKLVYKDGTSRLATCSCKSKSDSMKSFIKSLQKELSLTKACPGSKFKSLFISNFEAKVAGGYVVDNSDE